MIPRPLATTATSAILARPRPRGGEQDRNDNRLTLCFLQISDIPSRPMKRRVLIYELTDSFERRRRVISSSRRLVIYLHGLYGRTTGRALAVVLL